MTNNVCVVDDDPDFRAAILELLQQAGCATQGFDGAGGLLDVLEPDFDGIVLTDLRMSGMSGLALQEELQKRAPDIPVVMITAHGDISAAVEATRKGAFDFLEKSAPAELMVATVKRALTARRLELENQRLRHRIEKGSDIRARLLGHSDAAKSLRREIMAIAEHGVSALLVGEPGSCKDQVARVIHDFSGGNGSFIRLNCAGLDPDFLKGEKGKTGTTSEMSRPGKGDTIFLEHLAAQGDAEQLRLLSVLERCAFRVLVAVTPQEAPDLSPDIIFRLNLVRIDIPPLRDRGKDIMFLFEHYLHEAASRHNRPLPKLSAEDAGQLNNHRWPGNQRELQAVADRLAIGLRLNLKAEGNSGKPLLPYDEAMQDFEISLLMTALDRCGGRKAEAASLLRIPRKRLYLRLRANGLQ